MLVEAKDLAAVAAQPLEDAIAIEQAMIVDADLGVFFVEQATVDVNLERHANRDRLHRRTKDSAGRKEFA